MINKSKLEKQFSICITYPELILLPKYCMIQSMFIDSKVMVIEIYCPKGYLIFKLKFVLK